MTAARGQCKTCSSKDRARVEVAIANGVNVSAAARQFGLPKHSVWRHWRDHVTQQRKASLRVVGVSDVKVDLELKTGNTTINNNFLLSPDWVALRQTIALALRPYPEAQRAVLSALRNHETSRGLDITHARVIERPAIEHEASS